MYEELVKRLNALRDNQIIPVYVAGTIGEAADAIEELSKLADAIPHVCECCIGCEMEKKNGGCDNAFVLSPKRAMQYLIKPRWVPVTERLPESMHEYVLCCGEKGGQFVGWVATKTYDDGIKARAFAHGGRGRNITHWMPLPEPPKEGEA